MPKQRINRLTHAFTALGLCVALVACGGGGSADNTSNATAPVLTPVLVTIPATSPVTTPAPPLPGVDANCGLNGSAGIQAEILQRVNAFRAAGAVCGSTTYAPAAALSWNTKLLQAATGHSNDMATNNYFSHTSLDGRTFTQRILAAGYSYSAAGENIAAGQTSVQDVMTAWINSPGHCQNMMTATFQDIAVACVRNDASTYRLYWTMELGRV
jgi:uncharacterized protein YkwD